MALGRIFGAVAKIAAPVARQIPGVGLAIAGFEGAKALGSALGGGRTPPPTIAPPTLPQLPPPPGLPPGGLNTIQLPPTPGGAIRAGAMTVGRRILPVAAGIAAFELIQQIFSSPPGAQFGDATLPLEAGTATVRPPKGYVLVRNPMTGEGRLVKKELARASRLWKPAKKPPISVGQMSALRKAASARNALKRAEKLMNKACPPKRQPRTMVLSKSVVPQRKTVRRIAA